MEATASTLIPCSTAVDVTGFLHQNMSKRLGTEDGGAQKKRRYDVQPDPNTARFIINSRNSGAIIGKGGERMKAMRERFSDTTILLPDTRSVERILYLTGPVTTVCQIMREVLPQLGLPPHRGNGNSAIELNLLVHTSHAGCIIGHQGKMVQDIRQETGSQIKIFTECCPGSTDRILVIGGELEQAIAGLEKILLTCRDNPVKGSVLFYDPGATFNQQTRLPQQPQQTQVPQQPWGDARTVMEGTFLVPARDLLVDTTVPREVISQDVTVPVSLAGTIIGRGGQRIRDIRLRSGAGIKINDPEPGSTERVITMTGTLPQIEEAERLMKECLRTRGRLP